MECSRVSKEECLHGAWRPDRSLAASSWMMPRTGSAAAVQAGPAEGVVATQYEARSPS